MLQFYLVDILRNIQNPLVLVQGRDTRAESQESRRKKSCIQHLESKSLKRQSRSSAGQSATLIMQRSAVRACPRLLIKLKVYSVMCIVFSLNAKDQKRNTRNKEHQRGISSAGQSACLARRRSRVRLPYSPQFCEFDLKVTDGAKNNICSSNEQEDKDH